MLARSLAGIAAMLALSTVSPPLLVAQAGNQGASDTSGADDQQVLFQLARNTFFTVDGISLPL